MNLTKGLLKMGAVLITGALILTGCGSSSFAPQKTEKPSAEMTLPTPTGSTSGSGMDKTSKSLSQVDTDLDQVERTLDKTLDSLDQSLDALDFDLK